LGSWTRIYQK